VTLTTSEGQTIEGRVRAATGVVDPQSRAATIVVTPTAETSTLSPGQLVQARILATAGAARSGIMVPQDAIQTLGQQTVVFVRTRAGFKARPVRIGSRSGGMAAITEGLSAGTPIATVNAFLLKAELEKNAGGGE
jgi:cobalt-zinc-cadmium efflux system membrane fusion protein